MLPLPLDPSLAPAPADWREASERLNFNYGDNEVLRAAYEIYGRKEGHAAAASSPSEAPPD